MKISKETREWLLDAPEPYIRYQAQRLLTPESVEPALLDKDSFIQDNLKIIGNWKSEVLARHDKPDLFMHRLSMLADLGVTRDTKGAGRIIESLLSNFDSDGSFKLNIMIPTVFGGSGEAHQDWIICDFPVILYALLRMAPDDPRLEPAVNKLVNLKGEKFYPCCGSIPKFKGPGPRNGMCPYANLLVAHALSALGKARKSKAETIAAGAVLDQWTNRADKKPFLFGMGTDFKKLKYPMVWYNILHTVHGLRNVQGISNDLRFLEIADLLRKKLDDKGCVKPESVYMCYKNEEWSNKKSPSRLLTILVHEALAGIKFQKT